MLSLSISHRNRAIKGLFLIFLLLFEVYLQQSIPSVTDFKYIDLRILLNVFIPVLIVLCALVFIYINEIPFRFNWIDLILNSFILFQIVNYQWRYDFYNDNLVLFCFAAAGGFLVKQLFSFERTREYLLNITLSAIISLGIFEVIYGQLQIFGITRITNVQSVVTGTFNYPGPFAILISSVLVFCVGVLIFPANTKLFYNKTVVRLSAILVLISLPIIPSTQSRSAWVGLFAGLAFLFYTRYKENLKHTFRSIRKGFTFFMFLSMFVVISCYGLYLLYDFKSESVHGRLRVWDITFRYFADHPVTGIGHGQFKYEYGKMQSEFIGDRVNDLSIIQKADYVKYVFNDFLQILVENGLIGFFIFVTYIYLVLKNLRSEMAFKGPYLFPAIGAFGTILVSCLFSYPLEMPLILTVFFLFGNIISFYSGGTTLTVKTRSLLGNLVLLLGILLVLSLFQREIHTAKARGTEWAQAMKLYHEQRFDESITHFEAASRMIPGEPEMLMAYGRALYLAGNYQESEHVLKMAVGRIHDSMVYVNLGDAYFQQKKYALAEQAYLTSVSISPDRLYPRFLLANLYMQAGQVGLAKQVAKNALKIEAAVPSPASDSICTEMRKMLL